jgi:hypothetical protein
VTAPATHEAPVHTHDRVVVCTAWHLTARTPTGRLVPLTTADLDRLRLPVGWVIVR